MATGVIQQIEQHLRQTVAISQRERRCGIDSIAQLNLRLLAFRCDYRQRLRDQIVQVQRLDFQAHTPGLQRCHILHIADQPAQALHLASNQLGCLVARARLRDYIVGDGLAIALDRGQRRHQVMGDIRSHIAAQLFLFA